MEEDAMGPYGVLANEYVRKLTAMQFEEAPRRDRHEPRREDVAVRRRRSRLRNPARGFRQFAEVLLR
jgi:hypothetical protein